MSSRRGQSTKSKSFVSDISDWIRKNGNAAASLTPSSGATFVDVRGVRRYLHNWQPAEHCADEHDFSDDTIRYMVHHTGCRKVSVLCEKPVIDTLGAQRCPRDESETHIAIFLTDWERLWSFFEADNEDEIAVHAPLLRSFVEFVFHRRTCQLMLFLFAYNTFVLLVLEMVLPPPWGSAYGLIYEHLGLVAQLLVYLALLLLYKGTVLEPAHPAPPPAAELTELQPFEEDPNEKSSKRFISYHSLGWVATCAHLQTRVTRELRALCRGDGHQSPRHTHNAQTSRRRLSFYQLMNVALKFLARFSGADLRRTNFNRRSYRAALVFIATGLPLYQLCYSYIYQYAYYVRRECADEPHGDFCTFYIWQSVATLGLTTRMVMQYFYGASVVLSLVGLAYAGEIAHRLARSWMDKFCCLRKIHVRGASEFDPDPASAAEVGEETEQGDSADGEEAARDEEQGAELSPLHARGATPAAGPCSPQGAHQAVSCASPELRRLLLHDATEHYLFLREVMAAAGQTWSVGLTGLFALAVYVIAAFSTFIIFVVTLRDPLSVAQLVVIIAVRVAVLLIYPVASVCHANACVYELMELFAVAAPDDFALLGGRDRWVGLLTSSPAVWTYHGLWITYARLRAVGWTAAAGLGAFVLSRLFI